MTNETRTSEQEEQKYLCKPRDMNYTLEQARACGNLYGENACRLGGKCSVLEFYFHALPQDFAQTPPSHTIGNVYPNNLWLMRQG